MKAITIYQPWASLISCGKKKIETRAWNTNYRGKLAIHAGKTCNKEACRALREYGLAHGLDLTKPLPSGCVIAIAQLVDCQKVVGRSSLKIDDHESEKAILENGNIVSGDEYVLGDYTPGRYAWILHDVQLVNPIPARGRQRLWNFDMEGGNEK